MVIMPQQQRTKLGQVVAGRRGYFGLSQEELADAVGVERTTISGIETGRIKQPSPEIVNKLSSVLRVSVADLTRAIGFAVERDDELFEAMLDDSERVLTQLAEQLRQQRRTRRPNGGAEPAAT